MFFNQYRNPSMDHFKKTINGIFEDLANAKTAKEMAGETSILYTQLMSFLKSFGIKTEYGIFIQDTKKVDMENQQMPNLEYLISNVYSNVLSYQYDHTSGAPNVGVTIPSLNDIFSYYSKDDEYDVISSFKELLDSLIVLWTAINNEEYHKEFGLSVSKIL